MDESVKKVDYLIGEVDDGVPGILPGTGGEG